MRLPCENPTLSHWLSDISLGSTGPFPSSDHDTNSNLFDVAIIGAGLSGASIAYHLRKINKDCRIIVLDARDLSGGATGRNGGILWPGWVRFTEDGSVIPERERYNLLF